MIPLANCDITSLERQAVYKEMEAGMISGTGERVFEFERLWMSLTKRKHAIATSNGTSALELALEVMMIGDGDEVIVPALTFVAPAAAVVRSGAKPVFADVDMVSWTLDLDHVEQIITSRTKAIIAVNIFGHPCDYEPLYAIARKHSLQIIEDAAESHGAKYGGAYTGEFGDISVFSFHANKTITTGEGGIILTDDDWMADKLRLLVNHGMKEKYVHEIVGTNARMTNLTAAIGCAQMQRWDEIMARRDEIAKCYQEIIPLPFKIKPSADWAEPKLWLQAVTIEEGRDRVVESLRSHGIDSRAIWKALPDMKLYRQRGCDNARAISESTFLLPTYNTMGDYEFDVIEKALRKIL